MIKRFSPMAIGRWSTCRPVLAIAAWLTFVVAAVLALSLTGSKPLENGAVGESARGYALMDSHRLGLPAEEYVYLRSATLSARSPAFQAATRQVAAGMHAALGGAAHEAIAGDRHAALVTGQITGPSNLGRLEASVAAVPAAHPGVSATVVDPTSGGGSDLHRAEQLSIPVTLVVLLISFGAR